MQVYGDNVVIEPGVVKGAEYTYFIESKAILWVQSPDLGSAESHSRGVPLFFLAIFVAGMVGIALTGQGGVFFLPLGVAAVAAVVSLVKSFRTQKAGQYKLLVGAGESTAVIYATSDAAAFEAKRIEIERALLGRPLNEED